MFYDEVDLDLDDRWHGLKFDGIDAFMLRSTTYITIHHGIKHSILPFRNPSPQT